MLEHRTYPLQSESPELVVQWCSSLVLGSDAERFCTRDMDVDPMRIYFLEACSAVTDVLMVLLRSNLVLARFLQA